MSITYTQNYNEQSYYEELDFTIPKAHFQKNFDKVTAKVRKEVRVDGFRKGHVPLAIVAERYGKEISDESIQLCISDALNEIKDLKPRPLDNLALEKVSFNNDGDLVIKFAYLPYPEVELFDIADLKVEKVEPKTATDEEVEKELANVWFHYASKADKEVKREDYDKSKITEDFFKNTPIAKDNPNIKSYDELKDFVKKYIDSTYIQDAKIEEEKKLKAQIEKKAKFKKLEGVIERELEAKIAKYKENFTRLGLDADKYLKEKKVDLNKLKSEWKEQIEIDAKFDLVLQKYGADNDIKLTQEEIDFEYKMLPVESKKQFKDEETTKRFISFYLMNKKAYNAIVEKIESKTK